MARGKSKIDLDAPGPAGLRRGVSTGTCVAACVEAGARHLLCGVRRKRVSVDLPDGSHRVDVVIHRVRRLPGDGVRVEVIKRSGEECDQTDGATIFVEMWRAGRPGVTLFAGDGVGIVTAGGLPVPVGEPAINPVPRRMIAEALERAERSGGGPVGCGWRVLVGCVGGEQIALRTFNPRLGIEGGISILGTTGLVEPKSEAAFLGSIDAYLGVALAGGVREIVLAPGNIGERFAREQLGLGARKVIQMSNFFGYTVARLGEILERDRLWLDRLWIVGHPGKLAKVLDGEWDTHSSRSGSAVGAIARVASELGWPAAEVEEMVGETGVEGLIGRLGDGARVRGLWEEIERRIAALVRVARVRRVSVRLFGLGGRALGEIGSGGATRGGDRRVARKRR